MELKVVLLLVFSLIKVINSQTISCSYIMGIHADYTCKMTIENPDGFDEFGEIEGEHQEGMADDDVWTVSRTENSTTIVFPSIICQKFKNLKQIDFPYDSIEYIDENALSACEELEYLRLQENNIKQIPENLLINNWNLIFVSFSQEGLKTVPSSAFSYKTKMKWLYLHNNEIEDFTDGVFDTLVSLEALWLGGNQLTTLPDGIFRDLTKLVYIDFSRNKIAQLNANWFASLASLQDLHLDSNQITELPQNVFAPLVMLRALTISNNSLTVIHSDAFGENALLNRNFYEFYFYTNRLEAFDERIIDNTIISWISAGENPCVNRNGSFYDGTPGKSDIRAALQACFDNYLELVATTIEETTSTAEATTSTTAVSTTSTTTTAGASSVATIRKFALAVTVAFILKKFS